MDPAEEIRKVAASLGSNGAEPGPFSSWQPASVSMELPSEELLLGEKVVELGEPLLPEEHKGRF